MVNQIRRNGSFAPLSAHYYDDEAVMAAGERAELLYVRSLAFSARKPRDGLISEIQLEALRLPGIGKRVERLLATGLWVPADADLLGSSSGYQVASWLKHNASKAEIEEKQRKDAERKRGGTK
jgi:hypothetical protein